MAVLSLAGATLGLGGHGFAATQDSVGGPLALADDLVGFQAAVGGFTVRLTEGPQFLIEGGDGTVVFASGHGAAFVAAAVGEVAFVESRFHKVAEQAVSACTHQSIDRAAQTDDGLRLSGSLRCAGTALPYELKLGPKSTGALAFSLVFDDKASTALGVVKSVLIGASHPAEGFYGFGEQFSYFDLKGRSVGRD